MVVGHQSSRDYLFSKIFSSNLERKISYMFCSFISFNQCDMSRVILTKITNKNAILTINKILKRSDFRQKAMSDENHFFGPCCYLKLGTYSWAYSRFIYIMYNKLSYFWHRFCTRPLGFYYVLSQISHSHIWGNKT